MEIKAIGVVLFRDILEEGADKHFGILFESGFVLCLCCGGYIEPEDYVLIEYCGWAKADDILLIHHQ